MHMLLMRPNGQWADGTTRRVPIVRERARKYGPILDERVISVRKDLLIAGPNASGKTRWLAKLNDKAGEIWAKQPKLFLRATEPLQRWCEDDRIIAWAEQHHGRAWSKLRAFERVDALVHWVHERKAVLLLDDAHKLTGRKLDVVLQLCRVCGRLIIGTWSEPSLPMSLRLLLDRRDPQRIHLQSEAAYDITSLALWLLMLAALMIGWWQLAAVVAGMKVLAGGRRAARQH